MERVPGSATPRKILPCIKRKKKKNSGHRGQYPVLRAQCRFDLPGWPQLHCHATNQRNRQHSQENRGFIGLRRHPSRSQNTIQSIINDTPNSHGCIILVQTEGKKPRRQTLLTRMAPPQQSINSPERRHTHVVQRPQICSVVSRRCRIRGIIFKHKTSKSIKNYLGGDETPTTTHPHPLR